MNNSANQVPYLRTSREFSGDIKLLTTELSKSYIDIANVVNARTIGIFTVNVPSVTGESWYIDRNLKQQSLRKVYLFTTTADIPLGFKVSSISQFSRFEGQYLSVTSWYGLNAGTNIAIAGQITFYIEVDTGSTTTDLIKFAVGAGAPALTKGKVILEWLSYV